MDGMAVEDVGPVVLALLKSPEEYIGQTIGLSTGKLTEVEYATVLSQETGKTVKASKVRKRPLVSVTFLRQGDAVSSPCSLLEMVEDNSCAFSTVTLLPRLGCAGCGWAPQPGSSTPASPISLE